MVRDALVQRPALLSRWPGSRAPASPSATDRLRRAIVVAVPAWAVSRVLAVVSLGLAHAAYGARLHATGPVAGASGWWVWDGGWYRALAEHGYGHAPAGGIRFFPLFPLLGRGLGAVLGGHDGVALVLLANLCALAFAVTLVLLVEREVDAATATRTAWLTLLAPGAVVLALPYSEPIAGLLAAAYLLAVRAGGRAVWWAAPVGLLAGLTRPTGVLLAVVAGLEVLARRPRGRRLASYAAAAAGPVAGAAAFCVWSAAVNGDLLRPYTSQSDRRLRGAIVADPVRALLSAHHGGLAPAANVAIAVLVVALLVVVWRVLPTSIAVWSTLSAAAALTSAHAMSLPRYLSANFPLLVALAVLARSRTRMLVATTACVAGFVAVAVTGFGGTVVL